MLLKFGLFFKSNQLLIRILLIFSAFFFSSSSKIFSQINIDGIPLLKNYTPDDYKAHRQNWAITRDKKGTMYFANNLGLLQYDGANWTLFENAQSSILRSLAVDHNGNIYYGASQDFGVVVPDSLGNLKLESIYKAYNPGDADFNEIWCIQAIGEYVFFQSREKIFRFKLPFIITKPEQVKNKITLYEPQSAFHWSFNVHNKFYVREIEKGLLVLENDKLKLVPGGEIFANEKIYVMLPYENTKILICTREGGLYIFNPEDETNSITKLECKSNSLLVRSQIYGGVALGNNRFAISTLTNGVIIIDKNGNVIEQLSEQSGLPDQQIYCIYNDNITGNLWFASAENGIFKANYGSPFKEWNRKNGLNGVVADIIRFKGIIYAATSNGVFYLDDTKPGFSTFEPITQIPFESWDLQLVKSNNAKADKLLVGTAEGVFEINRNKATRITNIGNVFQLYQSNINNDIVYMGYAEGFGRIQYIQKSKKWDFQGRNNSINSSIRSIYEKPDGKIYLGTEISGMILMKNLFDESPISIDSSKGLPLEGADYKVYQIDQDIVFASQKGLFYYNENESRVKPYLKFGNEFSGQDFGVYSILKTENEYWLSVYSNKLKKGSIGYELVRLKTKGNGFIKEDNFSKIIPQKLALALYNDSNFIWVANEKGLFKFDKTSQKKYDEKYNVNILKVTTDEDSVLFGGTFYENKGGVFTISLNQPDQLKPELSYKNNKISFEYSAAFYEEEDKTEYSFRLIGGANDKWSKWTNETKFPFTNLSPGTFRFEIRARNIYGTISNEVGYEFTILPPWYLTVWAFILFFICAILFIWLIVKLNIRRLELDKIKLEGIIEDRTLEIRMKNVELEQQKEEITAQRDEIEVQKDHVTLQKDQIEEQKKNITDSILYASKIQLALLPPEPILDEFLPEHFIIWKPRDIVSGDFYWTSQKNNKTVLVAADCTGHGVPGAFMSMLGISYLNEIMNKFEKISAAQVLDELKASVKAALRQTGKDNESKDGMDMSLCILDYENMQMEYAGAYNSMILIRDNKVIKIEADRMPIGIYVKERNFTNHIIKMQKDDWYYIHSDGYVDQFGGEFGSKLMVKRFKDLLLQNHTKTAIEQKQFLETFLQNWLSYKNEIGETYKQLDDILVIGFKI